MEIRRFGVGNRRPDGPPGTRGIAGRVIHADGRGAISELAFARRAAVEPHSNPNTTWFVVIEGGGWVRVGDEQARVAAGEAVLWPADVVHGAWTELSEMRAIVVELAGADDTPLRGILDGRPLPLGPGSAAESDAGASAADGAAPDGGSAPAGSGGTEAPGTGVATEAGAGAPRAATGEARRLGSVEPHATPPPAVADEGEPA